MMDTAQSLRAEIGENIERIHETTARACQRCGRKAGEITIVGIAKFQPAAAVREAVSLGIKDIGENRVQEALTKWESLKDLTFRRHFVGRLQTNKAGKVLGSVDLIQSLASEPLALEIQKRAERKNIMQDMLIQIDTAGEETKQGISPGALPGFLDFLAGRTPRIRVLGLMTIGPNVDDLEKIRAAFAKARELFDRYNSRHGVNWSILSMGMSNDFETAIEEGATMIRLGAAIFGARRS